ncbi:MAG: Carbamoyl-phosphate synthase small chain [Patescibacteria group bacterium]|nr:Carbamoyl-phosphate synthase small chain [Patescibacteria group bacterium]
MIFNGVVPAGQAGVHTGEVVFNTGMTGYVESLTDPSYAGQILMFTYPLIGNYGVGTQWAESDKIQVSGVIVSEAASRWSHSVADRSLLEWLRSQNIPILMGVDTRALTKHLRVKGTMAGSIGINAIRPKGVLAEQKRVFIESPVLYNEQFSKKVVLVDCGSKKNILRSLLELPVQVKRVPCDYDYTNEAYDGVLLSNGPGDPTDYPATIDNARKALKLGKPTFGICLGSQIMGLAAGAKTYKLKYGHRGHNQPCLETDTTRGFITSQNHGYAIDEASLPKGWFVSFRNLNDQSVEGIAHRTKPFFSVQFHPEACPGPTDTEWLFERFYTSL